MSCTIRRGEAKDLQYMQRNNLYCLPENYAIKFFYYQLISAPYLLYVAENPQKDIIGYCIGSINTEEKSGHIVSIAVFRSYRKMGLAKKLMSLCLEDMKAQGATQCSLNVRVCNIAAQQLYLKSLDYAVDHLEEKYYADGEDAFYCTLHFDEKVHKEQKEKGQKLFDEYKEKQAKV